jgi:hypothetical protein
MMEALNSSKTSVPTRVETAFFIVTVVKTSNFTFLTRSWDISVDVVTGYELGYHSSIPSLSKHIPEVYRAQTASWAHPTSYPIDDVGFPLG